ncbi:alpha/beta fold hydrolase [Marinirhabdus gelatinilytica]|uniref:Pimeloyl-ACP methyl ester carboxylesterase n=1 Tax=Marinirhabdus gelatinilytica TaxID=1703343 RepID=A0A370QFY1_9FLAO|nr:alpha/beta hydrolase [Marinirhabdus gelatinilytica]RDK87278.1 pimeloyl-ACP methyl ester carboxylesterase [Marinirhabdus gelatinilytica]
MELKNCIINNHRISYLEVNPSSEKTILFIHGNSLSKAIFTKQLESQQLKAVRMLALDLPGHGDSQWLEAYSVHQIVEDLVAFCDLLKLKDYTLAGHSLGGHMAIQALPKLKNCSSIFLIGTPPLQLPLNIEEAFMPHPAIPLLFKKELSESEIELFATSLTGKEPKNFVIQQINNTDPYFRESLLQSIQEGQMKDEVKILKNSKLSVSLFFGNKDELVNFEYVERLKIPKLVTDNPLYLRRAKHIPQVENYIDINEYLSSFINRILKLH